MNIVKKYYWLIPVVGGIISLIGLIIPVWYSPPTWIEYVWMIGIIHHVTGGNVYDWAPIEMLIPSIIATIVISISSVIIFISLILKIRGKKFLVKIEILWIILAILELCAMIGYIFGIQHGFYLNTDIEFWTIYVVQFGLFLPFIGMGMIAIGALIGKILNRE